MSDDALTEEDIGGVHIKYLLHCPRQLWLYSRGIRPEPTRDLVAYGNAIDATSYTRQRPVDLGVAKVDWVDTDGWVHERTSSQREQPGHREQALLYCLLLHERGVVIEGAELHYPTTRRTVRLAFDEAGAQHARGVRQRAIATIRQTQPPERLPPEQCRGCAFEAYCWSG